jgi:hypothetical protein
MGLLGPLENWKALAPIVLRITVNAIMQFPGITVNVMEVIAQWLAFTLLPIVYSDCQAAVNSVRVVIHSQLKRPQLASYLRVSQLPLTHIWNGPVLTLNACPLTEQNGRTKTRESSLLILLHRKTDHRSTIYSAVIRWPPALLPWTLLTLSPN